MLKIYFPKRAAGLALLCVLCCLPMVSKAQLANGQPKFLGNIVGNYIPTNYDTYWNQVTPENGGKWGSVESARGIMNWADLDKAYNYSKSKSFPFKQHALVWGMQEPNWVAGLSAAEQAAEVEEWIRLYAQRYPATDMIDVVNEPLHVVPSYANAIGGTGATGWDWVIWSFQKARQYSPNAKLLLNDYGILGSKSATSNYLKIINLLKQRGLIDGIGVQAHGLEYAQSNTIQSNLNSLAQTGIPIYVTELDLEHADDVTQRDMYKRVFPLLYEHPGVTAVTLWGYLIGEHWKPNAYLLGSMNTLATRTATTSFQDYTVSGSGKVQVHLTNDNTNNAHDLEIDYVIIDGITYQAEDMPINTGVWSGTCGGSYSQMLNCNGYIEFPEAKSSITVRARGTLGTESMEIRTVDHAKERLALQWLKNDYFKAGGGTSPVNEVIAEAEAGMLNGTVVSSSRPGFSATGYVTDFNATGEYVEVKVDLASGGTFPLAIRYASDASISRTIKVNGSVVKKGLSFPASATFTTIEFSTSFVAGINTIQVYVDRGASAGGDIDYIKITGATAASSSLRLAKSAVDAPALNLYPNPAPSGIFKVDLREIPLQETLSLQILDMQGRVVFRQLVRAQEEATVQTKLPAGLYLMRLSNNHQVVSQQKLIVSN